MQTKNTIAKIAGKKLKPRHGMSGSTEYQSWAHMIQRVTNINHMHYARYGGSGITICPEWYDFQNFFADMGYKPDPKDSIDRIDNNGNYEPSNCRWADQGTQARNTSRNHVVTFNGQTRCLEEWAYILGMKPQTLNSRLKNWSTEKAFTTPIATKFGRGRNKPTWNTSTSIPARLKSP